MKVRTIRWYRKEEEMYSRTTQKGPEIFSGYRVIAYYSNIAMWFTYCFHSVTSTRGMSQREKFEKQYLKWKTKNEG